MGHAPDSETRRFRAGGLVHRRRQASHGEGERPGCGHRQNTGCSDLDPAQGTGMAGFPPASQLLASADQQRRGRPTPSQAQGLAIRRSPRHGGEDFRL